MDTSKLVLDNIENYEFSTSEFQASYEEITGDQLSTKDAYDLLDTLCISALLGQNVGMKLHLWCKVKPKVIRRSFIGQIR